MIRPTGILLAGGQGHRFRASGGGDKLLHHLSDGRPVAVAALAYLQAACAEVVAVLRPGQEEAASMLWDAGARIVISEDCAQGMGHTLAAGVNASAKADGWLLALADMPFIRPATVHSVANALNEGASIAAPMFDGKRGHPVGFSASWREQLSVLNGERGARELLQRHADCIQLIECGDAGIHADIDVLQDTLRVNHAAELHAL